MKDKCISCARNVNGSVPLAVHENLRAQSNVDGKEKSALPITFPKRRLWIVVIILIVLLFGSNLAWLVYESQYENYTVEQEVDTGSGDATVIGVEDYNGEGKTESNGASEEDE